MFKGTTRNTASIKPRRDYFIMHQVQRTENLVEERTCIEGVNEIQPKQCILKTIRKEIKNQRL